MAFSTEFKGIWRILPMMPSSPAWRGKLHGNILRSQQTLLSFLSPIHARPQVQLSVGFWQQEVPTAGLWLHLSISLPSQGLSMYSEEERSQAFLWGSGSCLPHSFWGNSWKVAFKNSFVSCIPSRIFISCSFQAGFYRAMGELDWMKRTGSMPLPIPGTRSSNPNHSSQSPQLKLFTDAETCRPLSPSSHLTLLASWLTKSYTFCLSRKTLRATFSCFWLRSDWKG